MSAAATNLRRQWIPVVGGSCDVRMGPAAWEQAAPVLKGAVGRPRVCLVVARESLNPERAELVRRQLVSAGFEVFWHRIARDASASLDEATRLASSFARHRITADDLCCAVGDAEVLSLASWACGTWCGQTTLVALPTNETALLEGALIPRALDVDGLPRVMAVRSCARHCLLDLDLVISSVASETARYVRALMVAAAMAGSERVFSELWDRADALAQGDEGETVEQLLATAKSRGQAASSTAAAIRQSLSYGQDFAQAIERAGGQHFPASARLGEGLRFCARLSVGMGKLPIDDMLAQDELLEALGVGGIACDVDPQALVQALKDERFLRTNRFMQLVPLAIGRVRLATVPNDLLLEHVTAWCGAHAAS